VKRCRSPFSFKLISKIIVFNVYEGAGIVPANRHCACQEATAISVTLQSRGKGRNVMTVSFMEN
jgi:hypothetical protein